ncbi:FAD/NAD(P)-binding domain-containing protein [Nemania abortiva]|nr:FAD/NAD(P)-binding domain-containing protein [Nemania abortiva]
MFRVIIIGAGPSGLSLANMLVASGVDFIVLERYHTVLAETGTVITLWPHSVRVLDQLGLLDTAVRDSLNLLSRGIMNHDGKAISNDPVFKWIKENHGYPCLHYPRPCLTRALYNALGPFRSRIRTSVLIKDIETDEHEVRVLLRDGTMEVGSIVIGADGVHSQTRRIMQRFTEADQTVPPEKEAVAVYQCMFGSAPQVPGSTEGVFWESRGRHIATQCATADNKTYFAVYRRMKTAVRQPCTFDGNDESNFLNDTGHIFVAPGVTIESLRRCCHWTRLTLQPEGSVKFWHHGRIALCGDAAVQMTSLGGMGYNLALQMAVVLVNKITGLVLHRPEPTFQDIVGMFTEYQEVCQVESQVISQFSATYIRGVTGASWVSWFFFKYIAPYVWGEREMTVKIGHDIISRGWKLDIGSGDLESGTIPWTRR